VSFWGVRIDSETKPHQRARTIFGFPHASLISLSPPFSMPVRFALSFLSAVTIWVAPSVAANEVLVKPRVVTTAARYDTDDPAIWVNRANPADSLVIGTDKDEDGALMVFGLDGVERKDLSVRGILRPNNVDLAYDIAVGGKPTDVAVVAERYAHRLRVYSLPDMRPIDGGGIPVFEGERARDVMGIVVSPSIRWRVVCHRQSLRLWRAATRLFAPIPLGR
jgi:hypothetical protein